MSSEKYLVESYFISNGKYYNNGESYLFTDYQ